MFENRPFTGEVYLHWNTASGKGYVGQTTQSTACRWRVHLRCSRSVHTPAYRSLFAKALRKYGPEGFEHQLVAVAGSQAELDGLERLWIWALQTKAPNGYNLPNGGDSGTAGHVVMPEVRVRLSAAAKEQWSDPGYREKHRLGMIASHRFSRQDLPETIEKRASKMRGRKQSAETIAKRVSKTTGLKRSIEFREQCAVRMTGRKFSTATRLKMSESQKRRQEKNHGA